MPVGEMERAESSGTSPRHHLLRLRGISGEVKGKTWESVNILRAGRIASLEIVLDDSSVSRRHAEVTLADRGWWVRDLGSTNGTFVNGVRLGQGERQLHSRDILQFGKVAMIVEIPEATNETSSADDQIIVEAETNSSWQEGFDRILQDRNHSPRPGDQVMTLLRAGHHLSNAASEDELLHLVLNDAVHALDAQRAAIVLAEGPENNLKLRALATGRGEQSSRFSYSKSLAKRCFSQGQSILCCSVDEDEEVRGNASIHDGAMASVLCVLLRTPRKHLGVIHLDRSYWQKPFTVDDLHLADALAAHVSSGIETAQLMRKQREMHIQTIAALANAIEARDPYTAGHTQRVTTYAVMIAEQMNLSAKEIEILTMGGQLHDVGKIGIRDEILLKPGKLEPEERAIMESHTTKGDDIVKAIPELADIRPIIRNHHERFDGNGYPDKLAGEAIPLLARVLAVADSFDAMTTKRSYNANSMKTPDQAFKEVLKCAGSQFDPTCAEAFFAIKDRVLLSMAEGKRTGKFQYKEDDEQTQTF